MNRLGVIGCGLMGAGIADVGSMGRDGPDGTRIEVKSSGYLQAWTQAKLSTPVLRVAPAYGWDAATGAWSARHAFNADVYVFCLHTATTHQEYDPLSVVQWSFHVTDRHVVEAQGSAAPNLAAGVARCALCGRMCARRNPIPRGLALGALWIAEGRSGTPARCGAATDEPAGQPLDFTDARNRRQGIALTLSTIGVFPMTSHVECVAHLVKW